MSRKLLVGVIVAGALTATAGTAFALASDDGPSSGAAPTATVSAPASATTTSPTTSGTTTSGTTTPVPSVPGPSGTTAAAPAELSAADASRIVVARIGGTVHEVEREMEHGRLEWKVEVTAGDGVTYDVRVDAVTGGFTRVDRDDDGGGRGRGGDRDGHRGGHDDD